MLVPVDDKGDDINLADLGVVTYEDDPVHMNDDEISAMLKKPVKQIETWLENIEDPAELHAIFLRAKEMDLSAAKLKVLKAKMPSKEFLED